MHAAIRHTGKIGEITVCMASSLSPVLTAFYLRHADSFLSHVHSDVPSPSHTTLLFHQVTVFLGIFSVAGAHA